VAHRVRDDLLDAAKDRVGQRRIGDADLGGQSEVDPGLRHAGDEGGQGGGEIDLAVAVHLYDLADFREQALGEDVCLAHVLGHLSLGEVRRHLEVHAERGEVMAERVVELARDARPLGLPHALGEEALCGL
jgi:hypothetical protein